MPTLDEHQSSKYAKILYIGDSGTGKTGSLVSLVADGYKLKIIDFDNGLDILRQYVQKECPQYLKNIEYETYRDMYVASQSGPVIRGTPKAFTEALKKVTEWSAIEDDRTVLVIDPLTGMGRAALAMATAMNPGAKDRRQIYGMAQDACEKFIDQVTGDNLKMNLIVISHVKYDESDAGITKGYPSVVGSALNPVIARYFNTLILAESSGVGKNTRRKIKTLPTGVIDLKTPAPFKLDGELPLETGLLTIFNMLKSE